MVFHEWRSHEWKSLANHVTSDQNVMETLVDIGSCNGLLPGGTKPLPGPLLIYCQLYPLEQTPMIFDVKAMVFAEENAWENSSKKRPFCQGVSY